MKRLNTIGAVFLMAAMGLSGCFGDDAGTDPDSIDEDALYDWAVANDGYRQMGGLESGGHVTQLTETESGGPSAADVRIVNQVHTDASVDLDDPQSGDLAKFAMDAKDEMGQFRSQIRSVVPAQAIGVDNMDFQGGAMQNVQVFGTTGHGPDHFPETKAYILLYGQGRLTVGGTTLDGVHPFMVAVTKAVHDADGTLLDAAREDALELHVYFPGRALGADFSIPGQTDDYVYIFFTNVDLKQMSEEDKDDVGDTLVPAEIPNQRPIASAVVLVDGVPSDNATRDRDVDGGNLTVTLDGSNSTDVDGEISIYSWEVKSFRNNTSIQKIFNGQGETVDLNLTEEGWYLVTLRVIDDRFEPAEDSQLFYVSYQLTYAHSFDGANSLGAGQECNPPVNCKDHQLTMRFGAQNATLVYNRESGTCQGSTIEVYAPGPSPGQDGEKIAEGSGGETLEIAGAELTMIGQYTIYVWFSAQATCSYTLDTYVNYAAAGNATAPA